MPGVIIGQALSLIGLEYTPAIPSHCVTAVLATAATVIAPSGAAVRQDLNLWGALMRQDLTHVADAEPRPTTHARERTLSHDSGCH